MFASLGDRHMYISTGRHAKDVLTDSLATQVFERMKASSLTHTLSFSLPPLPHHPSYSHRSFIITSNDL